MGADECRLSAAHAGAGKAENGKAKSVVPPIRAAARPAEAHPVHFMKAGGLVRSARYLVESIQSRRRTGGAGEAEDGRSASRTVVSNCKMVISLSFADDFGSKCPDFEPQQTLLTRDFLMPKDVGHVD